MTTRSRKWMGLIGLLAFAATATVAGMAWAEHGYGVGDGTGPIGVEPHDGTGEQHHGPPIADDPVTVEFLTGDVGYGVGDGTGPIGVEPHDGTGEQHHGPPTAVMATSDSSPTGAEELRAQEQEQEQLRAQEQEQLRAQEQEQLRAQEQEQVRAQEEVQEQEQLRDQDQVQEQLQEHGQLRDQEGR